ncbi:MAG: O-antigen ligase family protein [Bacilli bacterium]|nr:O-antigen ligase family protein [Bacilli bacterium]
MKRDSKTQSLISYPILIIDLLMFPLLGLSIGLIDLCVLKRIAVQNISDNAMLGLGLTAFIFTLAAFVFYIFVEYKYNKLKLKNVFLYLGIVIAVFNLIAVMTLPNEMTLPNDASLVITPIMRVYYIFSGFFFAILPYLCFYLIPRKVTSHHYLDIILYVVLGFALLTIVLSFITDWNRYINFFNNPDGIGSIFFQKNSFGLVLVTGMFISIILRIRHQNWKWSLLLIPFYIFLLFSMAKTAIVSGTLMLLIYIIVQLVLVSKKSKDNLIITLLIVGFFIILMPLFITGIIKSESGILFKIRDFFTRLIEHAKVTISTRQLIWDSAFKLLSSWRVIFGYGIDSYGMILHQVYVKVAPEWDWAIYSSHNFVIDLLGNGGIILLGIYAYIYGYFIYAAIKVRDKKNHWVIDSTLIFLVLFSLIGMFESSYLCGLFIDCIPSIIIIILIMSEYYAKKDKDEIMIRKDIVNTARKIKNSKPTSKLMAWNKKRLINEAKYIAYDLNTKIKL